MKLVQIFIFFHAGHRWPAVRSIPGAVGSLLARRVRGYIHVPHVTPDKLTAWLLQGGNLPSGTGPALICRMNGRHPLLWRVGARMRIHRKNGYLWPLQSAILPYVMDYRPTPTTLWSEQS